MNKFLVILALLLVIAYLARRPTEPYCACGAA